MYSPWLYKYRDSCVLYIPTAHAFGSVKFTHTLLVQTHTHDVAPPPDLHRLSSLQSLPLVSSFIQPMYIQSIFTKDSESIFFFKIQLQFYFISLLKIAYFLFYKFVNWFIQKIAMLTTRTTVVYINTTCVINSTRPVEKNYNLHNYKINK